MTKYLVDRMITGAYAGPLAKRRRRPVRISALSRSLVAIMEHVRMYDWSWSVPLRHGRRGNYAVDAVFSQTRLDRQGSVLEHHTTIRNN